MVYIICVCVFVVPKLHGEELIPSSQIKHHQSVLILKWILKNIWSLVFGNGKRWHKFFSACMCFVKLVGNVIVVIRAVVVYKLWQAAMDLDWIRETWLSTEKTPHTPRERCGCEWYDNDVPLKPKWWWTLISTEILFAQTHTTAHTTKQNRKATKFSLRSQNMAMVNIVSIFHQAPRFSFRLSFNNCFYSFATNYFSSPFVRLFGPSGTYT